MENGNVFCLCDFLFQSRFLLLLQNMHKKMTQPQFIENLAELCDGKDFPKDLLKVIVYHITRYTRILDNIIMLEKNATDIYRLNHNYHQMLLASGGASGIFFFLSAHAFRTNVVSCTCTFCANFVKSWRCVINLLQPSGSTHFNYIPGGVVFLKVATIPK